MKILAEALVGREVASNRQAPILRSILVGKRMVRSFLVCSVAGVEQGNSMCFFRLSCQFVFNLGEWLTKFPDGVTTHGIYGPRGK